MEGPYPQFVKRLRVQVTAEQLAAVTREAALTGVNMSEVVRRAIDEACVDKPRPAQ